MPDVDGYLIEGGAVVSDAGELSLDGYLYDEEEAPVVEEEVEFVRQAGQAPPPGEDLGQDIEALEDISPTLRLVSGRRNLALAIGRRLLTEPGFLRDITGDIDIEAASYGWDVRSELNTDHELVELWSIADQLAEQVREDPRIAEALVTARYDLTTATLNIEFALETEAGPFALVISVDEYRARIQLAGEEV